MMRSKLATSECTDKHILCITIITHVIIVTVIVIVIRELYSGLEDFAFIFMLRLILGHIDLFLLIPCKLKDSPRHFWVKNYLCIARSIILTDMIGMYTLLSSLHRRRISAASCAFLVEICDHILLVPRRHRVVRGEGHASALLISVLEACWRFIGNNYFLMRILIT